MKIFCIGQNKTGTTSIGKTLEKFGFKLSNQRKGELLITEYIDGKYENIIKYCKSADKFQDIPFSKPDLYNILDKEFEDAKFILTIRTDTKQWYSSLYNYHNYLFYKKNKKTKITKTDMINISYVYKGWLYNIFKNIYKTPDDDLYNEEILYKFYEKYNNDVIEYFKNKPDKLLVINLENKEDFFKLKEFLNLDNTNLDNFLHINATKNKII